MKPLHELHEGQLFSRCQKHLFEQGVKASLSQVGTHRCHSFDRPVCEFKFKDVTLWARWNVYGWSITVHSETPLTELDTAEIDMRPHILKTYFFEGFEDAGLPIEDGYVEGCSRFSASSNSDQLVQLIYNLAK